MNDSRNDAYVDGFQAARREGPYAHENADIKCPYSPETAEADEWKRGFADATRAQEASG